MDSEFRCRFPKFTYLSSFRCHLSVIPLQRWQAQKRSNTSLAKMWLHLHVRHFHLQAVKGFMFICFNTPIFDFPFRHSRHALSGDCKISPLPLQISQWTPTYLHWILPHCLSRITFVCTNVDSYYYLDEARYRLTKQGWMLWKLIKSKCTRSRLQLTVCPWEHTNASAGWHTESSRDLYRSFKCGELAARQCRGISPRSVRASVPSSVRRGFDTLLNHKG